MVCKFCEKVECEYWFGNWCEGCRKIKNLGNVYGFDRILEILEKCCIRNPEQLERKTDKQKTLTEPTTTTTTKEEQQQIITRSKNQKNC